MRMHLYVFICAYVHVCYVFMRTDVFEYYGIYIYIYMQYTIYIYIQSSRYNGFQVIQHARKAPKYPLKITKEPRSCLVFVRDHPQRTETASEPGCKSGMKCWSVEFSTALQFLDFLQRKRSSLEVDHLIINDLWPAKASDA